MAFNLRRWGRLKRAWPGWRNLLCTTTMPPTDPGHSGPRRTKRVLRPILLLLLFSYGMLLVWMDQGTISATRVQGQNPGVDYSDYVDGVPGLIPDLGLSESQYSVLGPMYTIGLVLGSFLFAALAHIVCATRLLGYGMVVWAVGSVIAGCSNSYGLMIFARIVGGFGAASVMTLTFPYIDDVAPPRLRTVWFGVLGLCQAVGIGIGYIAMGAVASAGSWHLAFWVQAGLGAPFIIGALLSPPMALKGHTALLSSSSSDDTSRRPSEGLDARGGADGDATPTRRQKSESSEAVMYTNGAARGGGGAAGAGGGGGREDSPRSSLQTGGEVNAAACGRAVTSAVGRGQGAEEGGGEEGEGADGAGGRRAAFASVSTWERKTWKFRLRAWLRAELTVNGPWPVIRVAAWEYNNWGYVPIEFLLQVFSFWGPRVTKNIYPDISNSTADFGVGATAILAGVVGSLGGGVLLDYFGSSLRNAFLFSFINVTLFAVFMTLALALTSLSLTGFLVLSGVGLMMGASVNPMNYAVSMWTVPMSVRTMSQALLTLSQRVVGDIPAPPVAAAFHSSVHGWRTAGNICVAFLAISMICYALGFWVSRNARDYRAEYEEEEAAAIAAADRAAAEAAALEAAELGHDNNDDEGEGDAAPDKELAASEAEEQQAAQRAQRAKQARHGAPAVAAYQAPIPQEAAATAAAATAAGAGRQQQQGGGGGDGSVAALGRQPSAGRRAAPPPPPPAAGERRKEGEDGPPMKEEAPLSKLPSGAASQGPSVPPPGGTRARPPPPPPPASSQPQQQQQRHSPPQRPSPAAAARRDAVEDDDGESLR